MNELKHALLAKQNDGILDHYLATVPLRKFRSDISSLMMEHYNDAERVLVTANKMSEQILEKVNNLSVEHNRII